ncbi:MAG TPA: hypothetical protein VL137_00010 [Polyangiaceae bacterium]|nr:hypothetical protein [Polyangiaceae bacterium]
MPKPSSFLLPALLSAFTLISLPAWASEKLMVVPFSGQKSQECTRHANKALEQAGHPLDKTTKPPTAGSLKEMRSAGSASGVKAFVVGKVALVGKTWQLQVNVYANDGKLLSEFPLEASGYPGLLKEIDKNLTTNVEAALAGMADTPTPPEPAAAEAPAAAPEPAPEEKPEPAAKPAAAEKEPTPPPDEPEVDEGPGPSPFYAALQLGAVIRNWTPKDALYKQLLGQENAGLIAPRISFGLYPAAFFSRGMAANLGVVGVFEQSISGQTQSAAIPATATTAAQPAKSTTMSEQDYHFALHLRVPMGAHQFGFSAGPGAHKLSTEIAPGYFLPDVTYHYFRFGLDSQFNFGDFGLGLALAYRPVSSLGKGKGEVASPDWFPKAEADGMDLGVNVSYNLSSQLAVLITGDYRRYGFNFHRVPADQGTPAAKATQPTTGQPIPVAGGASDSYLGFWAGVCFHLPH